MDKETIIEVITLLEILDFRHEILNQKKEFLVKKLNKQLALLRVSCQREQLCKHKRVIKSRLSIEDGKNKYCKDCQEWLT